MTRYAALLRAVNLGRATTLPMARLRELCAGCGFADARTYLASGNVVFDATGTEAEVKAMLEAALAARTGRAVPVMVRTGPELAAVLARNPFPDQPGAFTLAVFLNERAVPGLLDGVRRQSDERIALGERELYVAYGSGMGASKLHIPAAARGTGRNMNTVAKLAEMAGG